MTGSLNFFHSPNIALKSVRKRKHQYYSIKQCVPQEQKFLNITFSNGYMRPANSDWSGMKIAHIIDKISNLSQK